MHQAETAAFLNQKGGVGKTTSVVNVGAGLTILGKKVLVVDLDPQGHLTTFMGIQPEEIETHISGVLRGEYLPERAVLTRELRARMFINGEESRLAMSVIPATAELAETEIALATKPGREFLIRNSFGRLLEQYDYILFDCPPSLGLITINALAAIRKVFIPVQTEYLAFRSLENLMDKIESVMSGLNYDLVIGGLIATRYDGRKVLGRNIVQSLKERFGVLLLDTVIRENIALAESPRYGKDIFSYRPRSNGAEDYLNLSLEMMGRISAANELFSVERGVIRNNNPEAESVTA